MDTREVRGALLATIKSIAPGTDLDAIRPGEPLRPQIDLDSLDWLNFVTVLGERLGIAIPDADFEQLATLDSMVAYVAAHPQKPPGGPARAAMPAPADLPHVTRRVNGMDITVRPMQAQDLPLEEEFVRHLSSEARYKRFMLTVGELSRTKLEYLTDVDQIRHVALVGAAERDGKPEIVGVVRYIVDASGEACEFAATVGDAWHGTGLAGVLMRALIDVARMRGLARMEGIVLSTNSPMLRFTRQLGFSQKRDPEDPRTVLVALALQQGQRSGAEGEARSGGTQ